MRQIIDSSVAKQDQERYGINDLIKRFRFNQENPESSKNPHGTAESEVSYQCVSSMLCIGRRISAVMQSAVSAKTAVLR